MAYNPPRKPARQARAGFAAGEGHNQATFSGFVHMRSALWPAKRIV